MSAKDQVLVPHLCLFHSQQLTDYVEMSSYFFSCLLGKKRQENYVFDTDLAIWKSSHHFFLGLKLLSLKLLSHCALYQLALKNAWIAYVQKNISSTYLGGLWAWGREQLALLWSKNFGRLHGLISNTKSKSLLNQGNYWPWPGTPWDPELSNLHTAGLFKVLRLTHCRQGASGLGML